MAEIEKGMNSGDPYVVSESLHQAAALLNAAALLCNPDADNVWRGKVRMNGEAFVFISCRQSGDRNIQRQHCDLMLRSMDADLPEDGAYGGGGQDTAPDKQHK